MIGSWRLNQQNRISFVLVDAGSAEVPGLGNTFTLEISKNDGAFVGSAGTKAEIGSGWYTYLSTAAEANTRGVVAVRAFGAGTTQQNLEYTVEDRLAGAVEFTYTVTDSVTGLPIAGVDVWISTDALGANVIWRGVTDAFGVARDVFGNRPWLDPGVYRFWKQRVGYLDDDMPDVEVVP